MTDSAADTEADPLAEGVAPPATGRMVVTILGLVGFFDALYLWAHNAGLMGPIVCGIGDCGTVQASQYATIGPVPVSSIGAIGYLALIVLAFMGLQPAYRESKRIGGLLLAGSAAGVLFSAYLTYLEAFVIHAWCQYCVGSAIIITLIFLASLPELSLFRSGGAADGAAS